MSVASPAKHEVATRLLRSSQRLSYDPTVDVDWAAPLDPALPAFPLHRVSLYGTPLWESMTQEQRVRLSWHELASCMSVGLWFELCLMQALLRHAYDQDPHGAHAQYALTEIGDETRHSIMFARAAEALAPGARYRPSPLVHALGRLWKTVAAGPSLFASVLVAEETLDRLQRESLAVEGLLPLAVEVSRIHVTEEARHVSYARAAVTRSAPRLGSGQRLLHSVLTVVTAGFVVHSLIDPRVYEAVGLDREEAVRQARANPHRIQTRYWMAEKVVAFLSEQGIVTRVTAPLWRRLRLLR
jgi:hypothetical protein